MRTLIVNPYLNAKFNPLDYNPVFWLDSADTATLIGTTEYSRWINKGSGGDAVENKSISEPPIPGTEGVSFTGLANGRVLELPQFITATGTCTIVCALKCLSALLLSGQEWVVLSNQAVTTFLPVGQNNRTSDPLRVDGVNVGGLVNILFDGEESETIVQRGEMWTRLAVDNYRVMVLQGVPTPATSLLMGILATNRAFQLRGEMLEFLILPGTLPLNDIQKIVGYLQSKYGIV